MDIPAGAFFKLKTYFLFKSRVWPLYTPAFLFSAKKVTWARWLASPEIWRAGSAPRLAVNFEGEPAACGGLDYVVVYRSHSYPIEKEFLVGTKAFLALRWYCPPLM